MFKNSDVEVSILCITYNQEDYIEEAIRSFLMQKTNFKYEIIIHDDASTDNTAQIIKKYEDQFPSIIHAIYETENQYSKGVSFDFIFKPLVKGRYIAESEGDDFWTDPFKLQKQYDFLESHPDYSMCLHHGWNISKEKKYICHITSLSDTEKTFGIEDAINGIGVDVCTNSFFYRYSYFDYSDCDFVKYSPTGDYITPIVCALFGKIYYSPERMSAHRVFAKNSISESWKNDHTKYYDYLKKQLINLDRIDAFTEYQYHEIIENKKIQERFNFYVTTNNKEKLLDERFSKLKKEVSIKRKIMVKFPVFFSILSAVSRLLRGKLKYSCELSCYAKDNMISL